MATTSLRADSVRANPTVQPFSLGRIYRACRDNGVSYSRFGRDAVNDPRLVFDLRNGRELRPVTRQRIAAYIARLEGC